MQRQPGQDWFPNAVLPARHKLPQQQQPQLPSMLSESW